MKRPRWRKEFPWLQGLHATGLGDIDDEFRHHLAECVDALVESGMSREEAECEALRRFGDGERFRQDCMGVSEDARKGHRRTVAFGSLLQDVRFAFRTLRRRPLFTTVTLLTLGLGIGATTAMFSVVEGVLLRPLPYERPGELVQIWQTYPRWRTNQQLAQMWDRNVLSYPDFRRFWERQTSFEDVGIYGSTAVTFSGRGNPERLSAGLASHSLFALLGIRPALGRTFLPEEEGRGAPQVVVLTHAFWLERFGGDPGVLGRSISLDGVPFTIVGVLPAAFRLRTLEGDGDTSQRPFWIPIGSNGSSLGPEDHAFEAIGRLKPDATMAQATQEADALIRGDRESLAKGARLVPRFEAETAGIDTPLVVLFAASLLLLCIACGNISLLFLGEATTRRDKIATRVALGAGRTRILRQLLTESVLLGLAASALGVALALVGTRVTAAMAPPLPRLDEVGVSGAMLLFTATVGVATGAIFGVVPSFILSGRVGRGFTRSFRSTRSRRDSRLQHLVVSLEVALTVVLLISGGLLIRSLAFLLATDPGFQQEHLAEVRVSFPLHEGSTYRSSETRLQALLALQSTLDAVPGVSQVTGASAFPLSGVPSFFSLKIEGWDPETEGYTPHSFIPSVFPGYFRAMGIPLMAGRTLTDEDRQGAPMVAVVSESMARRFWPGHSALGARIVWGRDTVSVVGVVGDVRYESLAAEIRPTMYVSIQQRIPSRMSFVVRTEIEPGVILPQLREAVWSIAPEVPITRTNTVDALVSASTRSERFRTVVMVLLAVCAALLATSGVFGVTARNVTRRYREFGIRKALGASDRTLVGALLRATLLPGIVGVGLGLGGAYGTSRYLSGLLFGVGAKDPLTFLVVCGVTLATVYVATLVPSARVRAADPAEVLRTE